jgi:hypothetical protein
MLHPWQYEQARHEARFHLQVAVRAVEPNVRTPGDAAVETEVVRVFRGGDAIGVGDTVRFVVSVLSPRNMWDEVPVGGTIWTDYAALTRASHIEVFLNGDPPECEVALWQLEIIPAATTQPTLRGSFLVTIRPLGATKRLLYRLFGRWFGRGGRDDPPAASD